MSYAEFKALETEDYQNRGNNYPRSGQPVDVVVYDDEIICSFKNTSEGQAAAFMSRFARANKIPHTNINAWQDGDYHDDWVQACLTNK